MTGRLRARGRLAGAQQRRHRPARRGVVDVDRQEAACPVVTVPQRKLLVAVNHIAGVVDVQRHRRGFGRIARAVNRDHRPHQPCQLARGRGVLPPAHRRLTGKTRSRTRQLAKRQAEARIIAQSIEVVGILVAAGDRQHPCPQDVIKRMDHPGRIARVGDAGSKFRADPHLAFSLRQQQHPTVRGQPTAVKCGCDFLATN
jgi:hypothetical protein